MALNRARVAKDLGIQSSANGFNFLVVIEYFDSAASGVTLWAETFTIPFGATTTQLQATVVARGQEVRAALATLASAQTSVPNQTVVTVP
jgi:hypothetical protein